MLRPKTYPTNLLELELLSNGYKNIVGIDEVGRGAFAGPVVVCGYMYSLDSPLVETVNDSKLLSAKKRLTLFELLNSHNYLLKSGSVEQINEFGIGRTITNLISEIVDELGEEQNFYLIDGYFKKQFCRNSRQIKKGDQLHYSIATASIVAKVTRDKVLHELARNYPEYGFERNVGYGTAEHIRALQDYGLTPVHRRSFNLKLW